MEKTNPNVLRALRKGMGLSLENLANDLQVSKPTIARDEFKDIRKVDMDRLEQYAAVYGTSVYELLGLASGSTAAHEANANRVLDEEQAAAINNLLRVFGMGVTAGA